MKVGPLFAESIHTEKISRRFQRDDMYQGVRYSFFPICIAIFVCLLIVRLFWLQLVNGAYYHNLSDSNRIRTIPIHAPRGVIFDKNNIPLVINTPGYREIIDGKTTIVDNAQAIDLLAKNDTHLEIDSLRSYPCKSGCAHVVGYVGQISPDELKNPLFQDNKATDLVGKMGIERYYEPLLKGIDGEKLIEVDSMGHQTRMLGQTDPTPGQNITLTLDEKLSEKVAQAMSGVKKGASIVTTPKGEVLALFSAPSFDPNLFTMGKNYTPDSGAAYQSIEQILLDGTYQPLLNRAISGTYPPGSTFKLLTAASALQNNIIDSGYSVEDTGIIKIGDFSFANWFWTQYGRTDGQVNVVKAIQRSNDIFFYKVGQLVGVDRLSGFAKFFSVGSRTGIDIPGEASGLLPTKEWKQKTIGEQWYLGDDYHYGIGQGYLLTTPLQVNMWTQAIANSGTLYVPHILSSGKPLLKQSNLLTVSNTSLIREGMIEACSQGGVAWPLFNFTVKNEKLPIDGKDFLEVKDATDSAMRQVSVACKTGTAQHGGEQTLPHAWITLFAPAYHPQIVVTVLSEESGEGSNIAGPIAKKILEGYFEK